MRSNSKSLMEIKFIEPIRMYESTYILTPDLSEEEINQVIDKFNSYMENAGVKIINQEKWGFKKLAYPIQKKQSGYYVFTEFQAPASFVKKFEQEYRYDVRILRYLTVKLDKFAVAYNERRRNKLKGVIETN